MSVEYLIPHKHILKIWCKSKHFLQRYRRKREWVFFSEHTSVHEFHSSKTITILNWKAVAHFTLPWINPESTSEVGYIPRWFTCPPSQY